MQNIALEKKEYNCPHRLTGSKLTVLTQKRDVVITDSFPETSALQQPKKSKSFQNFSGKVSRLIYKIPLQKKINSWFICILKMHIFLVIASLKESVQRHATVMDQKSKNISKRWKALCVKNASGIEVRWDPTAWRRVQPPMTDTHHRQDAGLWEPFVWPPELLLFLVRQTTW